MRLAFAASGTAMLLCVASLLLIRLGSAEGLSAELGSWQGQAIKTLGALGAPLLGGLIAYRRPENPYGWLWCAFGFVSALIAFASTNASYASIESRAPGVEIVVATGDVAWVALMAMFSFLMLLFPDGRLPSRRWRVVARTILVVTAMAPVALVLAQPGAQYGIAPVEKSLGLEGPIGQAAELALIPIVFLILTGILLGASSLAVRFRRGTGVERQQVKLFLCAGALLGIWIVVSGFLGVAAAGIWEAIVSTTILVGLYAAIGIAILRYRLYDIDRIISRTLAYGALTAILGGGYLLAVLGLQSVLPLPEDSPLIVAVSTLGMVAAFGPLRTRIQHFVDRRFNRSRYDAEHTIADFAVRLRTETDLDSLAANLVGVVDRTMRPSTVSLWLRAGEGGE